MTENIEVEDEKWQQTPVEKLQKEQKEKHIVKKLNIKRNYKNTSTFKESNF